MGWDDVIKDLHKKAEDRKVKVFRLAVAEAVTRIVMRTPVDTGRARANWQLSSGKPGTSSMVDYDKSGQATVSRLVSQIMSMSMATDVHLFNNLEYVIGLEYGASKQAPSGMVRITIAEWESILQEAAHKVPA